MFESQQRHRKKHTLTLFPDCIPHASGLGLHGLIPLPLDGVTFEVDRATIWELGRAWFSFNDWSVVRVDNNPPTLLENLAVLLPLPCLPKMLIGVVT